jgi:hypothetical protein
MWIGVTGWFVGLTNCANCPQNGTMLSHAAVSLVPISGGYQPVIIECGQDVVKMRIGCGYELDKMWIGCG